MFASAFSPQLFSGQSTTASDAAASTQAAFSRTSAFDPTLIQQMQQSLISFNQQTGVVTINGTAESDTATVSYWNSTHVRVSLVGQETRYFDRIDVLRVDFFGRRGNDEFSNSTNIRSRAFGHDGDDRLSGGMNSDLFTGGRGADVLRGNGGDDSLFGNEHNDQIFGGHGNDFANGGQGNDLIEGESGRDNILGSDGDDVLKGGAHADRVLGQSGADTIQGGTGDDYLRGGYGADFIEGHDGHDAIFGDRHSDTLKGGYGNDSIYGGGESDQAFGGPGHDRIYGGAQGDILHGNDGDDLLSGGHGADQLDGGKGNDAMNGDEHQDLIRGDYGDDIIYGGSGSDTIYGGYGDDTIRGGTSNDKLFGERGNDIIFGGDHHDLIRGGIGNDLLNGQNGNDTVYGDQGTDRLWGGAGNDGLFGGVGYIDVLNGGANDDRLLVTGPDQVVSVSSRDARVVFRNGNRNWKDLEIETIDRGLKQLIDRTDNAFLLQDRLTGIDLTFVKVSALPGNGAAQNVLRFFTETRTDGRTGARITTTRYEREIQVADWNEYNRPRNDVQPILIIHEISHNWDSDSEMNAQLPGRADLWRGFVNYGTWRKIRTNAYYQRSLDGQWWYHRNMTFARSYGRTSPYEDWGSIWERYFSIDNPQSEPDQFIRAKLNLVDRFLTVVASR